MNSPPDDWAATLDVLSGSGLVEKGTTAEDYFDDSFAPAN